MEVFAAKGRAARLIERGPTICADLRRDADAFRRYRCVHGLGHGFMTILHGNPVKSLKACDSLSVASERQQCYGGVFMENAMAEHHTGHPSRYLKMDQPLYPCTAVQARYKSRCYYTQARYLARTPGEDIAAGLDLCTTAVEAAFRPQCFQGLGVHVAEQGPTSVATIKRACMMGKQYDARANCLVGPVTYSVAFYRSDDRARTLCQAVEADLRDVCLRAARQSAAFRAGLDGGGR